AGRGNRARRDAAVDARRAGCDRRPSRRCACRGRHCAQAPPSSRRRPEVDRRPRRSQGAGRAQDHQPGRRPPELARLIRVDLAFVTYAARPGIDPDDAPLARALERRGCRVAAVPWTDPTFDWSGVSLALLRSTWDYHHRAAEFLAWAERVAALTALWNPFPIV